MTNTFETIKEIVINRVAVMNEFMKSKDFVTAIETLERLRNELNGMMICLKNTNESDNFYCINYLGSGYEFGYYDADGKWYSIEK